MVNGRTEAVEKLDHVRWEVRHPRGAQPLHTRRRRRQLPAPLPVCTAHNGCGGGSWRHDNVVACHARNQALRAHARAVAADWGGVFVQTKRILHGAARRHDAGRLFLHVPLAVVAALRIQWDGRRLHIPCHALELATGTNLQVRAVCLHHGA